MSFELTNELVDEALCGIKESFVHEMLLADRLDKTLLKRFVAVAVPVAAAAAVVAIAFGVGRGRLPAASAGALIRHIDQH